MDINEIKKLIKEDKAKIIIVDEKGPTLVIMDYAEYRNMKDSGAVRPSAVYQNTTANYGEEIRKEQTTSKQPEEESLRIDDLPF